jgi:hypothetical protein
MTSRVVELVFSVQKRCGSSRVQEVGLRRNRRRCEARAGRGGGRRGPRGILFHSYGSTRQAHRCRDIITPTARLCPSRSSSGHNPPATDAPTRAAARRIIAAPTTVRELFGA